MLTWSASGSRARRRKAVARTAERRKKADALREICFIIARPFPRQNRMLCLDLKRMIAQPYIRYLCFDVPAGRYRRFELTACFENQLLDPPIQQFGDVQFGLRWARNFVDPTELLKLFARFSEYAQNLSLQAELVDPARIAVGAEQHLIGPGRDANRPGRARGHSARGRVRLVADCRTGFWINRHVDSDLAQKPSFAVENLDAAITAIRHVDVPLRIYGDAVRGVELSGAVAGLAP